MEFIRQLVNEITVTDLIEFINQVKDDKASVTKEDLELAYNSNYLLKDSENPFSPHRH